MIETDRAELEGALRALKGGASTRPGIPALTGVLVESDGSRATLTTTDLETAVRVGLEVGGAPARALVPFALFADAVKSAAGVTVRVDVDGSTAEVGGARIRLLPVEDFPALAEVGDLIGTADAAELAEAIGAVAPAASKDTARPVLTGVLLELVDGRGCMVATDSYRLHLFEPVVVANREGRWIIPARTLEYVRKLLGRKPAGIVRLYATESAVTFELEGGVRVTVRLIEGEFPNFRQLLPEPGYYGDGAAVTYDRAELAGLVKSAAPFARDTSPVRLTFEPAVGVSLSASSPDLGAWSGDTVRATVEGEGVTVAFNPFYLAGAVAAVGDGARLYVRDGLKPGCFESADGRVRVLVMPVRLPVPAYDPSGNGGVPGVGVNAPHEPSAAEREAGEPVSDPDPDGDPSDPGVAESGEPPAEGEEDPEHDGADCASEGAACECPEHGRPDVEDPYGGRTCDGCGRTYRPEAEGDRGLCCICERDRRMESEHGPDWRDGIEHGAPVDPDPIDVPVPPVEAEREALEAAAGARADRSELGRRLAEAEPAGPAWSVLAEVGDVDGVHVRLVVGADGGPWVDVRRFVDARRYSGPTRKGLAVRASSAGILAELLLDAAAASE